MITIKAKKKKKGLGAAINKFKVTLACSACKITARLLKIMGRNGTTLPGAVALKIYPDVLTALSENTDVYLVTGTNGKTTLTHMLNSVAEKPLNSFSNLYGSNLAQGITTVFIANSTPTGKCKKKAAILECDENTIPYITKKTSPKGVILNNFYKDQLDRYGDMNALLDKLIAAFNASPETRLYTNADCSFASYIAQRVKNPVTYFGSEIPLAKVAIHEGMYCMKCGAKYEYDLRVLGHMGHFKCPKCGFSRKEPVYKLTGTSYLEDDSVLVKTLLKGKEREFKLWLADFYNIYNMLAAVTLADDIGIKYEDIRSGIAKVKNVFWRTEKLNLGESVFHFYLTKNPMGADCNLNVLLNVKQPKSVIFGLNDNYADGVDTSWIWDANFEIVNDCLDFTRKIYVCGTRRYDMALRLKYAGVPVNLIEIRDDEVKLVKELSKEKNKVYIIGNYTFMFNLRKTV
ncbi:MAG TPA: hypothetical protein DCG28_05315 [Lachnospiraceae bacterium]|nr:hypothetical protein [Lachnospiraceae bacterium]